MPRPAPRPDRCAEINIRRATAADLHPITSFQAAALRILARREYERHTIERFIADVGTMPADLLQHGRMFVLEHRGEIVATGGWCWCQGEGIDPLADEAPNDDHDDDHDHDHDDEHHARPRQRQPAPLGGTFAEIAGLYVDPCFARIGLASWLLGALEADAARMGLMQTRIAATLTGLPLCQKNGYRPYRLAPVTLTDGTTFHTVALAKALATPRRQAPGINARAM